VYNLLRQFFTGFENKPRSGQVLLWLLRGAFGAVVISIAIIAAQHFLVTRPEEGVYAWLAFFSILLVGLVIVLTDLLVRDKQITTLSAIYIGLLLGLLLGHLLSTALAPFLFDMETAKINKEYLQIVEQRKTLLSLVITIFCCYICVSTLLQTKDEFRFIIPYVEFSKQLKGPKPMVLDTSVIIDGRIADICDTRFLDTKLIVPRFVLQELQAVADSSDKLKRNRGRRGLDMLKRMQGNNKIELVLHEGNLPELRESNKVDERLVLLARALGARVVTNDYNLNKIAQLQGVEVINLNELANAMKSVALPGELMTVKLVKAGDQPGQGVGYLEDGTMVVVESARDEIGTEVSVVVRNVIKTTTGRMVFANLQ
jgi:uncharacterized protein YacL